MSRRHQASGGRAAAAASLARSGAAAVAAGVLLLMLLLCAAASPDSAGVAAAALPNYAPANAFKYHRRASMPSLSVVSPLDVLRESQMSRILADRVNANNAFLSRIGKRADAANLLQVLEELSQAEEP